MLKLMRFWLPAIVCAVGIGLIIAGGFKEEAFQVGTPIFSVGLCIWLLNFLYRVGVSGDRDRDAENEAREYFAEHGHWPKDSHGTSGGGSR
jgi:hypothetical protein